MLVYENATLQTNNNLDQRLHRAYSNSRAPFSVAASALFSNLALSLAFFPGRRGSGRRSSGGGESKDPDDYIQQTDKDKWACAKCEYKTDHHSNVKRHVLAKHIKLRYRCFMCIKSFTQECKRRQHFFHDHGMKLSVVEISKMAKERGMYA